MLTMTDLCLARAGLPVLEGLRLSVDAGQAVVLRGPNGIGKTTLLRAIAGLQPPTGGRIEIDRDRIAYAGHADGIKPTLTVAENLTFWARVFGTGDIGPALAGFDLAGLADRPAAMLSAGQKRRLGLARLPVTGRALWLLDEPTVSLDAASVALFATAVRAHCAAGGAAVVATHIDLGFGAAGTTVDLAPFRARLDGSAVTSASDEAFL